MEERVERPEWWEWDAATALYVVCAADGRSVKREVVACLLRCFYLLANDEAPDDEGSIDVNPFLDRVVAFTRGDTKVIDPSGRLSRERVSSFTFSYSSLKKIAMHRVSAVVIARTAMARHAALALHALAMAHAVREWCNVLEPATSQVLAQTDWDARTRYIAYADFMRRARRVVRLCFSDERIRDCAAVVDVHTRLGLNP
jgi:hypothetical protein